MSLLVVGTVAFDEIETPLGKTGKILGGAATYVGLAASLLIDDIRMSAVVGDDFPQQYLDLFAERKINIQGIKIVPDQKSFFWSGKYHANMNQRDTITTDLNVLADFNPVLPELYRDSKYLMLGNLTPAIQKSVINQMRTRPKLICMDTMNFWMDTAWNDLLDVVSMVDVLAVNEEEARQLSGHYSLVHAARKILTMGPDYVIVKRGEHGALLFCGDEKFYAPAMPLDNVIDPTGAGDSFAGGFMGFLTKMDDTSFECMKNALIYGAALASFSVEKFGTERLLEISAEDINKRLDEFVKLVSFSL
ncbi:MAG: sugar kinase [Bacteroidia bacterium]|nr:MAG: sugar kinase [Bacteroidia bacterium]